jgi:ubiquinol-cytochrome c reductase iron-sulfur subunit
MKKASPKDLLISGALLLVGRRKPRRLAPNERERVVPDAPGNPRAELVAIALLFAAALCAAAFIAVYAFDRLPNHTQLLGASLGLSLLFIAAALIITAKQLVVTEEIEEEYPAQEHAEEQETLVQVVEESGSRLTRRTLFKAGLGVAGGSLGLALLTPAASLGPVIDMDPFYGTPWKRGLRLVDEKGKPWRADDIEENDFYTAFPEGADKEEIGSSLVVVRLPPAQLDLPPGHEHYAADGIVAYSKICTHAGCAISLYRAPLFQPDEPKPALVCPCHYSTFDPATGGKVLFGPAGRKLPMLPIYKDAKGDLRAGGNFDEAVGPSWWGVRMRKPGRTT